MSVSALRKKRSLKNIEKTQYSFPRLNLSLLVSLAFHGLFFIAIFPRLSLNENGLGGSSTKTSNTPLIELNAIEQTRLPNLDIPNFFDWDGFSPIPQPENNRGEVPLPQTRMYPRSNINPNPDPNFQFPLINNSNRNSLPNLPPPPNIPNRPIYLPNYPMISNLPQPANLPPPPPLDADALADFPPDLWGEEGNVITIEAEAESAPNPEVTPQPPQTANLPNSPTNSKSQNPPASESTVAVTSAPIQPSYEKLSKSLQADTDNTSNEQASKNDVQWRTEVKVGKPKLMNISAIYPRDACIRKLEGTATYGVTVNADGKVVGTKLIKSSGYPLFNNEAVRQIQARSFNNATGAAQAYHVYVDFKYNPDLCPSLSLDNLGKFPEKPTPPPPTVDKSKSKNVQSNPTAKPAVKAEPIKPLPPIESTNEDLPPIKPLPPLEGE